MPGPQGGRGSRRGWRGESASIRARQVGISALIGHDLPGWDVVVFDPSIDVGNAGQDPDLFLDNLPAPLVLDEILYALEMTAAIKRRVDRGRQPGQYVLTGSQQWSAMRSIAESLAGRAVFLDLEGFSLSEIAEAGREDHWLCPLARSTGSVHWLGPLARWLPG